MVIIIIIIITMFLPVFDILNLNMPSFGDI